MIIKNKNIEIYCRWKYCKNLFWGKFKTAFETTATNYSSCLLNKFLYARALVQFRGGFADLSFKIQSYSQNSTTT